MKRDFNNKQFTATQPLISDDAMALLRRRALASALNETSSSFQRLENTMADASVAFDRFSKTASKALAGANTKRGKA